MYVNKNGRNTFIFLGLTLGIRKLSNKDIVAFTLFVCDLFSFDAHKAYN